MQYCTKFTKCGANIKPSEPHLMQFKFIPVKIFLLLNKKYFSFETLFATLEQNSASKISKFILESSWHLSTNLQVTKNVIGRA
jgi:hypothetical protein